MSGWGALLPSKSTWTLPVWTEISRGNHMKKPGKKRKRRRRRRGRVPLNPRQFACIKICGQSRCLLFLLWQIPIPGKYYPADPVIFGEKGSWTQRNESDAWMRLAGAGRVRGHPGFGPSSGCCTGSVLRGLKKRKEPRRESVYVRAAVNWMKSTQEEAPPPDGSEEEIREKQNPRSACSLFFHLISPHKLDMCLLFCLGDHASSELKTI